MFMIGMVVMAANFQQQLKGLGVALEAVSAVVTVVRACLVDELRVRSQQQCRTSLEVRVCFRRRRVWERA